MANRHPTQQALIDAAQAEYRRARAAILLEAPAGLNAEQIKVMVSENVIRVAMEAVIEISLPATEMLFRELAFRVASYAISCLPARDQMAACRDVAKVLPKGHQARVAKGVVIQADWEVGSIN